MFSPANLPTGPHFPVPSAEVHGGLHGHSDEHLLASNGSGGENNLLEHRFVDPKQVEKTTIFWRKKNMTERYLDHFGKMMSRNIYLEVDRPKTNSCY